MSDQMWVLAILGLMFGVFAWQVVSKRFDPFAPVWMFMVGYVQIYVIQAITLRDWAIGVRGLDLVTAANFRAFWALAWYLIVFYTGLGRPISYCFPRPPQAWSSSIIMFMGPVLSVFGLFCATMVMNWGTDITYSPEAALLMSFPFVTMVGAILMVVTGRNLVRPNPVLLAAGLAVAAIFITLWIFNGKRSPALIGVLAVVSAFYVSRGKRPSWAVLLATAFIGSLCVAMAINWRYNKNQHEKSVAGFIEFLGDFEVSSILTSLNIDNEENEQDAGKYISHETLEYGGFLLMLDTVPEKSSYDYGVNYLRTFSTFIPRIVWPDKPLYGREQWIGAWIEGSEMKRDETFTGPAIGILGATQLNGGTWGTLIAMTVIALLQRAGYEYFRRFDNVPWVQAWWSLTYYCAWFQVVADDPMNWFYYNWGFTTMPALVLLWVVNSLGGISAAAPRPSPVGVGAHC